LLLLLAVPTQAEEVDEYNVPDTVKICFKRDRLTETYRISAGINPFYLRGDFDGDRKPDYAVLVEERTSRKKGIAVCLSGIHPVLVLWAGKKFRRSDDATFDAWTLFDKGPVEQGATEEPPPRLVGDAIHAFWEERASWLIYWDGKKFRWYQQAD